MIAGELVESYRHTAHALKEADHQLTPRQQEVLQLVTEGRSASEIGDLLCISPRTVEFHKHSLLKKLELNSTADLIRYAIKHKLV
jgi:DNA-binding NarL/FixJ family response regulator